MSVSKTQVLDRLRRVKGPDLDGNIVDLGLVSDILIKDDRVYFSITIPASRADELEPLRGAAEKVVREIEGVAGVVAVLTAEAAPGASRPAAPKQTDRPKQLAAATDASIRAWPKPALAALQVTPPIVRRLHRLHPLQRACASRRACPASSTSSPSPPARAASASRRWP